MKYDHDYIDAGDRNTSRHEGRNAIVILLLIGFASALADLLTGVPA